MKKALKITRKILLCILILLIAFLLILFVYHRIMLNKEDKLLENYPGELVTVDGHHMNIHSEGEGEHTLVFLAPAGDTSPAMTFKPLYSKLNGNFKTVVIEKFGYGMSDIVDTKRNYETMVDECREALKQEGIEAPYVLCPYSKSGLDALTWVQNYPDEVEAIISIDMAFPESYDNVDIPQESNQSPFISFLKGSGIIRLFVTDGVYPDVYSEEDKALMRALDCRKFGNIVFSNEMITIPDACKLISGGKKPEIPMLLFLTSGEGTGMDADTWRGFAYRYINDISDVKCTEFDCGHGEIIYKEYEQLSTEINEFIEGLK